MKTSEQPFQIVSNSIFVLARFVSLMFLPSLVWWRCDARLCRRVGTGPPLRPAFLGSTITLWLAGDSGVPADGGSGTSLSRPVRHDPPPLLLPAGIVGRAGREMGPCPDRQPPLWSGRHVCEYLQPGHSGTTHRVGHGSIQAHVMALSFAVRPSHLEMD